MLDASTLKARLKELIVEAANLQGVPPHTIDDAAPIFGEGLGLDSLDALQLAMSLEEHYGLRIPEGDAGRAVFASVNAIAEYVLAQRRSL
jgi:acyl carrier protein